MNERPLEGKWFYCRSRKTGHLTIVGLVKRQTSFSHIICKCTRSATEQASEQLVPVYELSNRDTECRLLDDINEFRNHPWGRSRFARDMGAADMPDDAEVVEDTVSDKFH